jgi:CRISPR-associated endonuclease/helicase Cas3
MVGGITWKNGMKEELREYYRYWGKAEKDGVKYHLLPYHCLDVAAVGQVLLNKNSLFKKRLVSLSGLNDPTTCYWILMFLGTHDIGKFSTSFQGVRRDLLAQLQRGRSPKGYSARHDSLGYLIWRDHLWHCGSLPAMNEDLEYWEEVLATFSASFTGHHGVPPQLVGSQGIRMRTSDYFEQDDVSAANLFISDLNDLVSREYQCDLSGISATDLYGRSKRTSWLIAGFVVLCDWIGSNQRWFPFAEMPMPLEQYWEAKALPQAKVAVREAGIVTEPLAFDTIAFTELFPSLSTPTPLQRFVAECHVTASQQLIILEDVTGSGKTEAGLFLARRMMQEGAGNGIFFGMPTMATSNAMFERLADNSIQTQAAVYQRLFPSQAKPSIVLTHSMRHLSDLFMKSVISNNEDVKQDEESEVTATSQCTSWLADNRKRALLADVGVGTIDQALLAVLPSRFQSLRLIGLVNHVLIIDEAHAYDPYMNTLVQNLLTFQAAMGGSAILLSATLPQHIRQAFLKSFCKGLGVNAQTVQYQDYPLATRIDSEGCVEETPIEAMPQRHTAISIKFVSEADEIIRIIVRASKQGKCVCWIRNTVHDAVVAHRYLSEILPSDKLIVFHAKFVMGDRLDKEKVVNNTFGKKSNETKRKGKVLIATQVVEQSLDLDFDLLISDLAPMDLLIQRSGRLHRHIRDEKGNPLPADCVTDRRKPAKFIIHSPKPVRSVRGDWFKEMFPKAAYVYPSHGCLWLTAHILGKKKKKNMKMPDDAREFVEAAFSEKADDLIPEVLRERDREAEGKWKADNSLAHLNMLKLEEGYAATPNQWLEDMHTPTRLGEIEATARLARWDGNKLLPMYEAESFPWDMSQVSIRSVMVFSEVEIEDARLREAVEELKLTLPDKGKWSVLIPMEKQLDGKWRGKAVNKKGKLVTVLYDKSEGVTVIDKETSDDAVQFD